MAADLFTADPHSVPVILIPEVRDFVRINAEIVGLLNLGHQRIRLEGAEGQRLIAAGLTGGWRGVIEVFGRTGPEFAANLAAPELRIIGHGSTLDGAGRGLRAGLIAISGNAGDGLGAAQSGGTLLVTGTAGHRAGLGQTGGTLAVLGSTGRLAGDRQAGGLFFVGAAGVGLSAGRGQRGGARIAWGDPLQPAEQLAWDALRSATCPPLDPALFGRG